MRDLRDPVPVHGPIATGDHVVLNTAGGAIAWATQERSVGDAVLVLAAAMEPGDAISLVKQEDGTVTYEATTQSRSY
jgi:hypothetical protein